MNKIIIIQRVGISVLILGIAGIIAGIFKEKVLAEEIIIKYNIRSYDFILFLGIAAFIAGIIMISYYTAQSRTWICKECYMRFEAGISDMIFGLPAGKGSKYIYCEKCRKKTICKGKRLAMNIHYF